MPKRQQKWENRIESCLTGVEGIGTPKMKVSADIGLSNHSIADKIC